jgi:hypothetical protein
MQNVVIASVTPTLLPGTGAYSQAQNITVSITVSGDAALHHERRRPHAVRLCRDIRGHHKRDGQFDAEGQRLEARLDCQRSGERDLYAKGRKQASTIP